MYFLTYLDPSGMGFLKPSRKNANASFDYFLKMGHEQWTTTWRSRKTLYETFPEIGREATTNPLKLRLLWPFASRLPTAEESRYRAQASPNPGYNEKDATYQTPMLGDGHVYLKVAVFWTLPES